MVRPADIELRMAARRARAVLAKAKTRLFTWEGGELTDKKRKKNTTFYGGFHFGALHVRSDDHVLIRNDDAQDVEAPDQCYVARIVELYDDGTGHDDCHRAVVQWYSRVSDLRKRYASAFPTISSNAELVLDLRKHGFAKDIDVESIFASCVVEMVPINYDIPAMKRNSQAKFYVRWQFTGCDKTAVVNDDRRATGKSLQSRRSLFKLGSVSPSKSSPHPPKSPVKNLMAQLFSPVKPRGPSEPTSCQVDSVRRRLGDMVVSPHKRAPSASDYSSGRVASELEGIDAIMASSVKKLTFEACEARSDDCKRLLHNKDDLTTSSERRSIRISIKGRKSYTNYYKDPSESSTAEVQSVTKRTTSNSDKDFKLNRGSINSDDETSPLRRTTRRRTPNIRYKEDSPVNIGPDIKGVSVNNRKSQKSSSDEEWVLEDGYKSANHKLRVNTTTPRGRIKSATKRKANDTDSSDSESSSLTIDEQSRHKVTSSRKLSSGLKQAKLPKSSRKATPAVPRRNEPCHTPQNALEVARSRLHVSVIPDRLPCRQKEFDEIYAFVEEKLLDGTSGCMYVSGVPGTGKTATVYEVIRCLTVGQESGEVPNFQFIGINGMKLTEPHQAYVQIVKELMNCKVTPEAAVSMLEKRFTRSAPRREPVVLLVDELDLLWTGRQDVLYNIFDWPARSQSKLVVVAIGNTMNLPEKIMMNRVVSRLGMTRMSFHAYTHKELKTIIMARIEELEAFMPDAVELVARKVAAVSGDARRALDICRRAAEIAEFDTVSSSKRKKGMVGMDHVDAALQEMFLSPKVEAIKHASLLEKMTLRAVLADFQQSGLEETTFSKVYCNLESLCCLEGVATPNASQAFAICSRLGSCRLLLVEDGRKDIRQRIRMNVSTDDVHYALTGF